MFAHCWTSSTLDIIDEILESACSEFNSGEFITPKLIRTSSDKLSAHLNLRIRRKIGDVETRLCNVKLFEFCEGIMLREATKKDQDHHLENLYIKLGRLTGKLVEFFRTKNHLREELKSIRLDSQWTWQLITCKESILKFTDRLYPDETNERRTMVEEVLKGFDSIAEILKKYPEFVMHGDINGKNVLVRHAAELAGELQFCILDFQDIQVGQKVAEVAITLLYGVLDQEELELEEALRMIPCWILKGYQKNSSLNSRLSPDEINMIPSLMALRLCQSLLNGQVAFEKDPDNQHVMETNRRGWDLLKLLINDHVGDELLKLECQ